MSSSEQQELVADKRFPRLDREVAAKLLKTCCKGTFGLLFQNMVEQERISSGGMVVGRVMLRAIFKHFQLEQGRIGTLGGRSLLKLSLAGPSLADLDAFREKYVYVLAAIPVAEQPKEATLFDHLLDELEKCTALKPKVEKARNRRESPVVLLVKALFGHPDAGGLWEAHLKGFISELGGREVSDFPGNFWFKESGLLLDVRR